MCGIFGHIGFKVLDLGHCTDVIRHRGPDSEGFLWYDLRTKDVYNSRSVDWNNPDVFKVAFGFRRLAIVELSNSSNQPFFSWDGEFAIIFNGEIYNYLELRKELIEDGHLFKTNSDTEVIIESFRKHGPSCVNFFNGMWAFSILDFRNNFLFCSRDRFGVKPFYYYNDNNDFIFVSEIKQFWAAGLNSEINEKVVGDYLHRSLLDHSNETFFKNIYNLPAGHNAFIYFDHSKILSVSINKYWELKQDSSYPSGNFHKAVSNFKSLFINAVNIRLRSDVKVGSCLSGGLDSSSIVSVVAKYFNSKISSFSAVFLNNSQFDESNYVKKVLNDYPEINSFYCTVEPEEVLDTLEDIIWHQDEPFPSFSLLAQWNVMRLASREGVKVLLDGQGADELLAGYRKYHFFYLKELLFSFDFLKFFQYLFFLFFKSPANVFEAEGIFRYINSKKQDYFFTEKGKKLSLFSQIGLGSARGLKHKLIEDINKFSVPVLLRYEDRNSMAFSVEARVPFMDFRLASFIISQPSGYLLFKARSKYILREAMKDVLPNKIRNRKDKLGFSTPQNDWMIDSIINRSFKEYFLNMKNPYLNSQSIYEDFLTYPNSRLTSFDFSRFYIFDRWYQMNFSNYRINSKAI